MKRIVFLMFSMFLLQNAYSQGNTFFDMEPKHTERKLKEYKQSPVLYGLANKQFKYTTAVAKKRIENNEYKIVSTEIKTLEKDSIKKAFDYSIKRDKFSQVGKIKDLINEFLNSGKPFDLKKDKLITAQKMAHANGINELIYADGNVNSALKTKFFVLKLNKLDLKVHLNKVTRKLSQMDLVEPVKKPSSLIDHRLKELRTKKRGLKRYRYITSKPKVSYKNGLTITSKITNPTLLKGQFKQIGKYYILNNDYKQLFKKGQLLTSSQVNQHGLSDKGYVGPQQVLIQDVASKEKFITKDNFLSRYAFSINGKFNKGSGTTVFAQSGRSYSNRN